MGGPGHSRTFRKLMIQAGFQPTVITMADIILAHSAACWLIPETARPKVVTYVGMPLVMARPRDTWIRASLLSLRRGQLMQQLHTRSHNTYYAFRQPIRNFGIMRHPKIAQPVIFPTAQTLFVANRYDPWPRGPSLKTFLTTKPWVFIGMPGSHENIWEDPRNYVTILNHYAKRLLA
jgi:hypothetical protein